MAAEATRTLRPEAEISHYRIVGPLGADGMGEVYLAQDRSLDRSVAFKILPPELVRSTGACAPKSSRWTFQAGAGCGAGPRGRLERAALALDHERDATARMPKRARPRSKGRRDGRDGPAR